MSEQQSAMQKGAPKAGVVCLVISAIAILLLSWYLDWAPYYKTYIALFIATFLGLFGGWGRSTDEQEAHQALRELNERDKDRR